jgi:hypothetical protein
LRSVAVALGGLLFPVVAIELGLRAVIARKGQYYRYTPHWRERLDQSSIAIPGFTGTSFIEINGDGERGDPRPALGERCYRVLVCGGSAAECYHLDQPATWAAVLQRRLNEPASLAALGAPRAHVGNVARAILTVEQLTMMLRKILPRYRDLDAVVLMVGAADVVNWMERGAPATIPKLDCSLDRLFEDHPEKKWSFRPRGTAIWHTLSHINRRIRRPIVDEPGLARWLPGVRRMRAEATTRLDEAPDPSAMLAHFEHHLRVLVRLLRGSAKRVILARQPWFEPNPSPEREATFWNFGLGRPYKETVSQYFTPRVVDDLLRRIDERATIVAKEEGVEQIELNSQLERSARTFYDELHFTPAGAADVGRCVAKALVERPC